MRIVSWNCGGGFRKKSSAILALDPDMLVVQEITEPDAHAVDSTFVHWVGPPGRKGMATFSFTDHPANVDETCLGSLPWFIPVRWNDISILASWACVFTTSRRYVRLMHEAIDHYQSFLATPSSIIIGDFNSSSVFDRKHPGKTHTALVERLGSIGITSAYHHATGEPHGEETAPTFFLYRHEDRGYHLDYAFLTNALLDRSQVALGSYADWIQHSDHLPLVLDLRDDCDVP